MNLTSALALHLMFFNNFSTAIVTGQNVSKIGEISDLKSSVIGENISNETLLTSNELFEQLRQFNFELSQKVNFLQNKLIKIERLLESVNSDVTFFNPTTEYEFVDLNVVNWERAVEKDFEDASVTFNAGQRLGAYSTWTLYLTSTNDSLNIHVGLQSESYNKGLLYVGFTLYIIDAEDNVYLTRRHNEINILEIYETWKSISILNVFPLSTVTNPDKKLLKNDTTFKLRVRLELFGSGHKLYKSEFGPVSSGKDTQTVIFEVLNLKEKIKSHNLELTGNETLFSPIAYTRFQLKHPWKATTNWIVDIREDFDKSLLLVLNLVDSFEESNANQLFASFKLKISNKGHTFAEKYGPLNDYKNEKLFLERAITEENLTSLEANSTVEFKLYLSVFGQNARYYVDL